MIRMTKNDFPTDVNGNYTRAAFIRRWNNDTRFRERCQRTEGIKVVGENVIFPSGRIANTTVK